MILCVGEILADMIGTKKGENVVYERKAGGAPFNVACAVKRFGGESSFVGCVGDDVIGDFLIGFVEKRGPQSRFIARRQDANTTLAFVELAKDGERSFCFYRRNTADYRLPDIPEQIFNKADIIHIGSLMLNEEIGFRYADKLTERARAAGKLVSFDINYRSDIFRNREEAVKKYKKIAERADIVKFSEDELKIFTDEYVSEVLSGKLVCLTLGGAGSEWRFGGCRGRVPSIPVKPIDTTGAGDAFYAGVLSKLDGMPREKWTAEFLNKAFAFANVCGALNTLGRGAIDNLPNLGEINIALKNYL